jgi:hypothetical protein
MRPEGATQFSHFATIRQQSDERVMGFAAVWRRGNACAAQDPKKKKQERDIDYLARNKDFFPGKFTGKFTGMMQRVRAPAATWKDVR